MFKPILHICLPDQGSMRGTIRGALLGEKNGTMQDWNYDVHHCMELAIYTGCCPYPHAADLPKLWKDNHAAMVQDVTTGKASVARVKPRGAGFVDIFIGQIHREKDDQSL